MKLNITQYNKMNKKLLILIMIFLVLSIVYAQENLRLKEEILKKKDLEDSSNKILLKSRQFIPERGINEETKIKIRAKMPKAHVLLQFDSIPSKEEKEELEKEGIKLLSYMPNKAWFASISGIDEIEKIPNIRAIDKILNEDKISPYIKKYGVGEWAKNNDGTVNLTIMFFKDASLDEAEQIIFNYGEVIGRADIINALTVIVPEISIEEIASNDIVQWIEEVPPEPQTFNDGSRAAIGVNTVQASPYNLNGLGVVAAEWDGAWVDTTHDDFAGRVTIGDVGFATGDHATHVAGTMLGNGTLSATKGGTALQWRGMATKATVISYEWWNDATELNSEYNNAINTYGIDLSQNSWGFTYGPPNKYGRYDSGTAAIDAVITGNKGKRISIMWAAGNERPTCDNGQYDCIIIPGTAKNTITVGATNSDDDSMTSFSSWGPTDDGRLKPDVMAPGCEAGGEGFIKSTLPGDTYGGPGWCGTSMATPAVSGSVALMLEDFANKGIYPLPSTIKAILIQTAKDLGNTGPDYSFGYGRINATKAIDLIRSDTSIHNVIIEDEIPDQGKADLYEIEVPSGQTQLKVTLAWDDYQGTPNAAKELVNDLDLLLISPSGTNYYPYVLNPANPGNTATTGIDDLNNVEQVVVNPEAGIWQVKVKGTLVPQPPQKYSLASTNNLTKIQFGHLEPYLIDPTSNKNVTQNKFFTFSSGVKCVGGVCGNVSATLDPETELIYDDGTAQFYYGGTNFIWAVRFTPPFEPFTVTKAKVQLYDPNSLGGSSHTLRVYEDNAGSPGSILATYYITITDFYASWAIILIDVPVTSGDFWIGITAPGDPSGTYMLNDGTGPSAGRSYFSSDGVSWTAITTRDLMIRAFVVEGIEAKKGVIPMNSGTPFYTISNNPQTCVNMQDGDTCNQTWQVNATGNINTTWQFFTIYDSMTYDWYIETNKTNKVNITIVEAAPAEFISITLLGFPIDFSSLDPGTNGNPATGNSGNQYKIRVDSETTINVDLYKKGGDYVNNSYILGIGNMTWNKINDVATSASVTKTYSSVKTNVAPNTNVSMYYWIDLPTGQHAGDYTSTIYIKAVETGTLP